MKRYNKLVPFIATLYLGIALILTPYLYRGFVFDFLPDLGIAMIIISAISYYSSKLSEKIDKNDSRLSELSNAGVDKIKIESKSSFKIVFDEINNANYLVDLKIIADIESIYENIFFIKDFIKNRRYDSLVTIVVTSSDSVEFGKQKSIILEELMEISKNKTNKKVRLRLNSDFTTINAIIYDNNVWLTYNTKKELENSLFIKVKSNSSFGRQIIDFYEAHNSKSNDVTFKQ